MADTYDEIYTLSKEQKQYLYIAIGSMELLKDTVTDQQWRAIKDVTISIMNKPSQKTHSL